MMLSQSNRISNQRLISKLNKEGKAYKTSHFVFKYLPSHSDSSKFTPVISKKAIPKAVDRNRARRQITESFRLNMPTLKSPIVCLAILKREAPVQLDYGEIDRQIKEFLNQLSADV